MNILLCGAHGFIGRHIAAALTAAGHTVRCGVRPGATAPGEVAMDFVRDTSPSVWEPRLKGMDAVVNTVGVLRDSPRTPMQAIHTEVPAALFEACARQGVRRVIHLSALGMARQPSAYGRTKHAAELALQRLSDTAALHGVVLQPSIVFGPGGASSGLFTALARWPVLLLPRPAIAARVQPVAVRELAEIVVALLGTATDVTGPLACVGPQASTLAGFIASLRHQSGQRPARLIALPDALTRASARLGDAVPLTPWGTQALDLLAQDNTADPAPFARLLGRPATHFSQLRATLQPPSTHDAGATRPALAQRGAP
jgi:uncharacterized protein YbjT (DUF2867 family)